ncbi:phage major capsid protein [Candidatus Pacearchaeota archaeon]|nr:phage major capsid protein [Candidatus Pacearchaeota archaeon]|tara:strand:- start:1191 stop:2495 length:1305 start_codon:yes stop_codon:yes gene_type:complete
MKKLWRMFVFVLTLPIMPIMGIMTPEEKTEVANTVADALKASGLLDAEKKFIPAAEGEQLPPVEVITSPEDKIYNDPKGGFRDHGEFVCAITGKGTKYYGDSHFGKLKAWHNAVTKIAGTMNEGDMSQGGYLVPVEFREQLLQTALEATIVKSRATMIPMQTNRISIPAVVDTDHSTNYFGGIIPERTAEHGTKGVMKPAFDLVSLTLHKLTGMVYVTDELLEDSPISIPPILNALFGAAIAFEEDDAYLQGTGVNMALGAFNAGNPCLITQAIEAAQPINTVLWQNIVNMWSRLHPASMKNAIWVANNETFPQLASMAMAVGAGGVPVWMPANGVAGTPFGSLMGRPLFLTEKMQALSTAGDIGLGDFSQYLVAQKAGGGLQTATSMHYHFNYDEQTFRFVLRYDGQPWWLSDLTPKRGTNTLSPFVILAGRP